MTAVAKVFVLLKFWCEEPTHRNGRRFLGEQEVPAIMVSAYRVYPPRIMCEKCGVKRRVTVEIVDSEHKVI